MAQTAVATGMTPAIPWLAYVVATRIPTTPPAVFGPPMINAGELVEVTPASSGQPRS